MGNEATAFTLALGSCTVLGCSGFPFLAGSLVSLTFDEEMVKLRTAQRSANFSYLELFELNVAGPGSVTTGGGFIGGGFGVEGALEGMAIATVLNALSTKTKIHTFISLITNFGELHVHHTGMEPSALRIALAEVHARLRRLDPVWLNSRAQVIASQLASGAIDDEESKTLLARLHVKPEWPNPEAERALANFQQQQDLEAGPKGVCPNCTQVIPLHSQTCSKCKAAFGSGSAWIVAPL